MALYELEHYLFRLKNDPALQQALANSPDTHLQAQGLDAEACQAILDKDVVRLWHMGVHPLLLVPLSRFFGIEPQAYRDLLAPHAGARAFVSGYRG